MTHVNPFATYKGWVVASVTSAFTLFGFWLQEKMYAKYGAEIEVRHHAQNRNTGPAS